MGKRRRKPLFSDFLRINEPWTRERAFWCLFQVTYTNWALDNIITFKSTLHNYLLMNVNTQKVFTYTYIFFSSVSTQNCEHVESRKGYLMNIRQTSNIAAVKQFLGRDSLWIEVVMLLRAASETSNVAEERRRASPEAVARRPASCGLRGWSWATSRGPPTPPARGPRRTRPAVIDTPRPHHRRRHHRAPRPTRPTRPTHASVATRHTQDELA